MIGQFLVVEIVSTLAQLAQTMLLVIHAMKCLIYNLMVHAQTSVLKDPKFGIMLQSVVSH